MKITKYIDDNYIQYLTTEQIKYLEDVFEKFSGYPSIEGLWKLMDEAWDQFKCNPLEIDDRILNFYNHPVWVLNGFFIEQDISSLNHRQIFSKWITSERPSRIADFGGGFGGLARLLGRSIPNCVIEIVEPHPQPVALALAEDTINVRYVPKLTGEYDLIIATDVFEHVSDPLKLCIETGAHLKLQGKYLIANCFHPVIKCHLPQLYHFSFSWNSALNSMGFVIEEKIAYGQVFRLESILKLEPGYRIAGFARKIYPYIKLLPKGKNIVGSLILKFLQKLYI